LLLASFPNALSHVTGIEANYNAQTPQEHSLVTSLTLMLLSATVTRITLSLDDTPRQVEYPHGFDIALSAALQQCKNLQTLELLLPKSHQSNLTASVTEHLKSCDHLRAVTITPVDLNEKILRMLAQLPCLEDLCCEARLQSSQEIHPSFCITGFKKVRILRIRNRPATVNTFLKCFGPDNWLEDLHLIDLQLADVDGPHAHDTTLFPESFSGKHISRLWVSSCFDGDIGRNVLARCAKFTQLHTLILTGKFLPQASDTDIVQGLKCCRRLRILHLCAEARTYIPEHDLDRPTLGCLQPLLDACKSLREIKGSFDLMQTAIPSTSIVSKAFPRLRSIDLATSYFVTFPPPDDWIEKTVRYLTSLFQGSCELLIEDTPCIEEFISPEMRKDILGRRQRDKSAFDAAVYAINMARLHLPVSKNA
jgi:hypothetical protein